jgi:hypothetical protein
MITLELFDPIPAKGRGRRYVASPEVVDDSNYIELGLIVKDQDGNILKDKVVEVHATDSSQDKTLNETGNFSPRINPPSGGNYYPFHYEFKTSGPHTISFTCEGESIDTTLDVFNA